MCLRRFGYLRQVRHGIRGFDKFLERRQYCGASEELTKEIHFAAKLVVGDGLDESFRGGTSGGVEFGDLGRSGSGDLEGFAFGGELSDQADGLRARSVNAPPGKEEIADEGIAKVTFETRNAAETGDQAQAQFRKSEARHLVGDDNVASQGKFQATAEANSVNGSNGDKRRRVNGIQDGVNALEKIAHAG